MHPHSSNPIVAVFILLLIIAGFMSTFLSSVDFSTLNKQIAEALLWALRDTGYSQKEIYMAMDLSKGQWSKVLSGEKSLSLTRLQRTPFRFYVKVWERLLAIKARDFASELREDAGLEQRVSGERSNAA